MNSLEKAWYTGAKWPFLLLPLEGVYKKLARNDQKKKRARQKALPVPVIVVGNITVGGTGKSPVVSHLCRALQKFGWHPGIVSRGYGSQKRTEPLAVTADSDASLAGDEPVMLAAQTSCPVVVDRDRYRAASALLDRTFFQSNFSGSPQCNLIISDDGLQHLSLPRDVEWVVIDASRGLGNGHCLPVGPLREPQSRLKHVDLVLSNGSIQAGQIGGVTAQPMHLLPAVWRNLKTGAIYTADNPPFESTVNAPVVAMAGIGNPERFFLTLEAMGVVIERRPYPDHYSFDGSEVTHNQVVVMTAKDAVKYRRWATENHWVLDVEADIHPSLISALHDQLVDVLTRKNDG